ncbi:MAG: FecR domain-containing protein [Gammaproteobacteria bacterium]|nr:FecR domain-containing protein [Gammaproteobacteria bacterium]
MSEAESSERRRHDDPLLDEAAEWIGRLRSPDLNSADREAFSRWLLRSPAHRAAFDTMADLWDGLGMLADSRSRVPAGRIPPRTPRTAAAAARLVIGHRCRGRPAAADRGSRPRSPAAMHETAPGEVRSLQLADGSRVTLNTGSRIRVRYGSRHRLIRLDTGGEAFFDVASDPRRPFIVETDHGRARAVGTAFSVHAREQRSLIGVTEGRVAVTPVLRPEDEAERVEVTAGSELFVSAGAAPSSPAPLNPDHLSWRQGRLVYDDLPLAEVINDLNRYMPRRMTISDPELARTRISAVLAITDQSTMLAALSEALPDEMGAGLRPAGDHPPRLTGRSPAAGPPDCLHPANCYHPSIARRPCRARPGERPCSRSVSRIVGYTPRAQVSGGQCSGSIDRPLAAARSTADGHDALPGGRRTRDAGNTPLQRRRAVGRASRRPPCCASPRTAGCPSSSSASWPGAGSIEPVSGDFECSALLDRLLDGSGLGRAPGRRPGVRDPPGRSAGSGAGGGPAGGRGSHPASREPTHRAHLRVWPGRHRFPDPATRTGPGCPCRRDRSPGAGTDRPADPGGDPALPARGGGQFHQYPGQQWGRRQRQHHPAGPARQQYPGPARRTTPEHRCPARRVGRPQQHSPGRGGADRGAQGRRLGDLRLGCDRRRGQRHHPAGHGRNRPERLWWSQQPRRPRDPALQRPLGTPGRGLPVDARRRMVRPGCSHESRPGPVPLLRRPIAGGHRQAFQCHGPGVPADRGRRADPEGRCGWR